MHSQSLSSTSPLEVFYDLLRQQFNNSRSCPVEGTHSCDPLQLLTASYHHHHWCSNLRQVFGTRLLHSPLHIHIRSLNVPIQFFFHLTVVSPIPLSIFNPYPIICILYTSSTLCSAFS